MPSKHFKKRPSTTAIQRSGAGVGAGVTGRHHAPKRSGKRRRGKNFAKY